MSMYVIQHIEYRRRSRNVIGDEIKTIVVPAIKPMKALCLQPLNEQVNGALALAHCQVEDGDPLRFFVTREGVAYVNPVILETKGDMFRNQEGCMSWADEKMTRGVMRWKKVIVSYTRVNAKGETKDVATDTVDGDLALIFQHEIDHMNGKHIYPQTI